MRINYLSNIINDRRKTRKRKRMKKIRKGQGCEEKGGASLERQTEKKKKKKNLYLVRTRRRRKHISRSGTTKANDSVA
ncbi:hypothetical protein KPH14_002217 [Odynerus spinipes]|uniref:Uncharacterized protein n=1 Tax=Odynerus spinipes TaxID=1348599 RepID=A0AAD9VPB0_9HYME|nr:hypothetical protein KPH14_002217 [Odynerus spinipes]